VVDRLAGFRRSGRKLILVTGRELPDLTNIFPEIEVFDRVVAENGAVLYRPGGSVEALGPPPPAALVAALVKQGAPVSLGRVIVATTRRHARIAAAALERHKLDYHIIFNKGAAMVLPSAIDKGTGLLRALDDLGITAAEAFGIGDAENDREFLSLCGCAAVVANALPTLKRTVALATADSYGAGVVEAMDHIQAADHRPKPARSRAPQRA
jgi:hydroxymethylpyrimidine pyrophosphatase-like HAD family hydrolase